MTSDQYIELNSEDRSRLKTLRVKIFFGFLLVSSLMFGTIYAFGFREFEPGPGVVMLYIFSTVVAAVLVFIVTYMIRRVNRDLNNNSKRRVIGLLISKSAETSASGHDSKTRIYILHFADLKLKVDKTTFSKLEERKNTEIEIAPNSETVLYVKQS